MLAFTAVAAAQKIAPLAYKVVPDWADLPAGWNFGEVPGVAIGPGGRVMVFHRGPHPIMEFESSGKFVRAWGDGLISSFPGPNTPGYGLIPPRPACDSCGAHAVRVDPEGNIWVVDAGGHIVLKMNQKGRIVMQLGRRGVLGTGSANFNMPTDVAFAPNGDFYVSDGYGNTRVMKFSRDGKFLFEWGTRGGAPGQFQLPHAIAVDAQGLVYVSDRETRRIEIFDPNGKFLRQWNNVGGFSGLVIDKEQKLWAGGGGQVLRYDLEGNVLGSLAPPGNLPGQISGVHGIAVSETGDVYVAELNWRLQKFVK